MPRPADNRLAAEPFDNFQRTEIGARLVDNFFARIFPEERLRQKTDKVAAFDKAALFVEQEAAVEIAVESYTAVRAVLNDSVSRYRARILQQRIWDAVREKAVGVVVNFNNLERQEFFNFVAEPLPVFMTTFSGRKFLTST